MFHNPFHTTSEQFENPLSITLEDRMVWRPVSTLHRMYYESILGMGMELTTPNANGMGLMEQLGEGRTDAGTF